MDNSPITNLSIYHRNINVLNHSSKVNIPNFIVNGNNLARNS